MRHRRVRVFLCLSPEFVGAQDEVLVLGRINQCFDDHRPGSLESLGEGVMHLCHRTHRGHRHAKVMARWRIGGRPEGRAVARKALMCLFERDELQMPIDQYHKHDWQPETYCRGHLSDHHQKSSVTRHADNVPLWMTQLCG